MSKSRWGRVQEEDGCNLAVKMNDIWLEVERICWFQFQGEIFILIKFLRMTTLEPQQFSFDKTIKSWTKSLLEAKLVFSTALLEIWLETAISKQANSSGVWGTYLDKNCPISNVHLLLSCRGGCSGLSGCFLALMCRRHGNLTSLLKSARKKKPQNVH